MKAFPQAIEEAYYDHGMDLRDYFAAKCITYSLAACSSTIQDACELSYQIADAMMKAREQ